MYNSVYVHFNNINKNSIYKIQKKISVRLLVLKKYKLMPALKQILCLPQGKHFACFKANVIFASRKTLCLLQGKCYACLKANCYAHIEANIMLLLQDKHNAHLWTLCMSCDDQYACLKATLCLPWGKCYPCTYVNMMVWWKLCFHYFDEFFAISPAISAFPP